MFLESADRVVDLNSPESSIMIKDEVNKPQSCSAKAFLPTLSPDVDIPMQQLNLTTANVQAFENNIPEIQQPKFDTITVISTNRISSTNSYSSLTTDNNIKPEKGTNVNSCSQQYLFDSQTSNNERQLPPEMYPMENSCLADPCDLPADRFSPTIIKVEDTYEDECSNSSTILPSDIDKSTIMDIPNESFETSPKLSSGVIKIEDNGGPSSSFSRHNGLSYNYNNHQNNKDSSSDTFTGKYNGKLPLMMPMINCKIEVEDDYPSAVHPSLNPPPLYPLSNDNLPAIPNLINSTQLSTSIPQVVIKSEENYEHSCQHNGKTSSIDEKPHLMFNGSCCCSVPEPPLLIRNDVIKSMNRYPAISGGQNKRLGHQNQNMSNYMYDKMRSPNPNDINNMNNTTSLTTSSNNNNNCLNNINNNMKDNSGCADCGKNSANLNPAYPSISGMIKIKEEKDLEYNSTKDANVSNELPSRSQQNPYMLVNDPRMASTLHNHPRSEVSFISNLCVRQKQLNPRMQDAQDFQYATNCSVQPNRILYPGPNQYDPSTNTTNREHFHANRVKARHMADLIHGVVNSCKSNQRDVLSNSRDAYMSVNGHVSPYAHGKLPPNHRLPMGVNPDEVRARLNNDPSLNAQFCPATNSYLIMNEHPISNPQSCINHVKLHQHRHRMHNPSVQNSLQNNIAKEHLFHPFIPPKRHMHPNAFPQSQLPRSIRPVGDKPSQSPHIQIQATHLSKMRFQNMGAGANRPFYPGQNQHFFPTNAVHINNHTSNNMPSTLNPMQENYSPNHTDIQMMQQQHNGVRTDRQISPPNFPKCTMCGKQFPNTVALREHQATHHMISPMKAVMPPRVQIKEEVVDNDYPTISNHNYPSDAVYNEQHPYMSRNPQIRHGMNPASTSNETTDAMLKQEGQLGIPNIRMPLGAHVVSGVNSSGVFRIHQKDNMSRIIPDQHPSFLSNNDPVTMVPNTAMSDVTQIANLQNPFMIPNGHIMPNSYPTSTLKTEDGASMLPIHQVSKDNLGQVSIHNQGSSMTEKTHKCDTCGETFTDYSKLKEHRKTHASEKQFSCELCDKTFTQNSTLKRHQRTHTREKPYKCEICGKSFSHNYNLKEHGKTHTGEKPYRCDICGKTFAQNYHLKEHQTTHSDAKPFKCDKCNKQFSLDSYLKKHQKIHTGEKPYKCDVCDKQFLQNSHLKDHRRIHTGEKPFKCEICGIRFSQNYTLKIHQRTHTGEKPYRCEICDKKFSQNSHLKEHRTRTHSGDKPFKCDQCHKEFSLDSYLKKHQKIHSGEKPFKCDICEKQFSQNYHLKEHRRIHTGEKPYKCQICDMRFSQNCSLKIHQRIHTGEKPYECEICGKQFSHSSNVKTHKRVHLTEKLKVNVNNPTIVSVSPFQPTLVDSKVNMLSSIPEIPQPVIASS